MITAASSAPSGWLLCDGTAVSRTTYSALFTAISTAYGVGDGSTTFNVPDFRGRSVIGAGAPTFADAYTSVTFSSNQLTVTSNSTRYITGMQVTASNISGLTGIGNGTTWVIRVDATHISFASSLANAQNGTVATVTGTGNITLTFTGTTRTRGDLGGEEGHAMSSTELLSHSHTVSRSDSAASSSPDLPRGNNTNTTTISTNSTGGNAAMSVMNPFGVGNWIIKT
jgi:microcystin-dependent protein